MREFVVAALVSVAIGACGRGSTTPPPTATATPHAGMEGGGMRGGMMEMCPMAVEGVRVTVDDIDGGVAVVFTTTTGDVADLRARVRRVVEMHARMSKMGDRMGRGMHAGKAGGSGMHGGQAGMHGGNGGGMMAMVPSDAKAIDVEGGARLELRPRDQNQLGELRAHARTHARQMASGQCPMMRERRSPQARRDTGREP